MLTPEQIRAVANDVTNIYSGVETACIESVVKRIQAGKKITTASLWQMKKLNDVGLLRRELIQEIKRQTKLAFPEIERLIKTAVKQSRSANALSLEGLKTYKGASKKELLTALAQSDSLAKTVKKLTASARSMFNITNTMAEQATIRSYVNSINKAYLAMTTGNATREEAIKQAVEEIGKSGIKVVDSKKKVTDNELVRKKGETYTTYYNNGTLRLYPLDSAIRRDFVTMVNQSTADLTISDCNDLGTHLVETSWHNGARPEHEVWQGKIFSLDPNDTRYPYFYGSLDAGLPDYGNPLGICGINCYHSFSPYFEGTEKTTKKGKKSAEENNKQYEQQQVQRSYERRLRQLKREQVAYRAGGYTEDAQRVQALINKTSKNYGQFLRDTGLTRVSMLERVEGYKRISVKGNSPIVNSTKQTLVGVAQGKPMSFEEADKLGANPEYLNGKLGATDNCQTCVVANEMRRRGYDVEAMLYDENNREQVKLAYNTRLAWLDKDGNLPEKIWDINNTTMKRCMDFADRTVKEGERYHMRVGWQGRHVGHIVCLDRINGELRMYDPQNGKITISLDKIKEYFTTYKISTRKQFYLTRVDNLEINREVVEKILKPHKP